MNTRPSRPLLSVCIGAALLGSCAVAHAAVGARVLLQEWSPLTPKQQSVRVLANDPSAVSDALNSAWSEVRPRLCTALQSKMGQPGAARGQTLYEIKCLLDETPNFQVLPSAANMLSLSLAISGYVEATSTTPTALGKYADPRFSLALTGRLLLTLSVQPNKDQTLRLDKAQFQLLNATLDSQNFTGDILKFVVDDLIPYFGGPNYKQLAEGAINSVGGDVASSFNAKLGPVNAMLRGPSDAVRVAVWGKPNEIVIAFGPRELTPPSGGTVSGALRWDTSKILSPGNCDSFNIGATVQTGPAPLRDPNGYYEPGDAPMRSIKTFQRLPGAASGECRYRVSGLAQGWPNEFVARSSVGAGKNAGNAIHFVKYSLAGDGWDGHTVVPQPDAVRNYVIQASLGGSAAVDPAGVLKERGPNPGGPVSNPTDRVGTGVLSPHSGSAVLPTQRKATTNTGAQASDNASATGGRVVVKSSASLHRATADAVSLNPQPLPPDPPEASRPAPRVVR